MNKQPKIPDDLRKKFEQLKLKLDKFKKELLKEFSQYVIGISLLPPKQDDKESINVLVLADDTDTKKMSKFELHDKLTKDTEKIAKDIDKNIKIEILLLNELRENCYDGKYEVLQLIGMSAPIYEAKEITGVNKDFHVQTYILTDFWDAVKDAHPVMFTFLRDGVPLYDRGLFMPWKLLLQMGRIKPSPEAIDMQMDVASKL